MPTPELAVKRKALSRLWHDIESYLAFWDEARNDPAWPKLKEKDERLEPAPETDS